MNSKFNKIISTFNKSVKELKFKAKVYNEGKIIDLEDGIASIKGLPDLMYNELVKLPHNIQGLAFNLKENKVGIIILGDYKKLKAGDPVFNTGRLLSIPVSDQFLGRIINPLGEVLDGKHKISSRKYMPLEKIAPGVIQREPVNVPLQTGIKAIDSIIPIGRGQRELIIGDKGTGKTSILIDTIINQKDKDIICIYVAIGQKKVRIARIHKMLSSLGAMDNTIIVAANASDPTALQYIAPYAGCAIGEYFMEQGKDVLIAYDDLTKHAWAYRELSLLMKRPSGREAYPGDIFYLHSRLLERACRLNKKYGGGSLTALPIIETQAGDISAYIPTNVISITDGQIYLEPDLFFAGVRPAINVGLSVSRVGGAAQIKAMKKVAGELRLELAQYRELAAFTQFSTELDQETKKLINRGSKISEIFKQAQHSPLSVEKQICIIWAATKGYLDDIPLKLNQQFEKEFLKYLDESYFRLLEKIKTKKELSEKIEEDLTKAITSFKEEFKKEHQLEKEQNANQPKTD